MDKRTLSKLASVALIVVLLLTDAAVLLPWGGVEEAEAGFPGPNLVVGFLRTVGALGKRNALYREAGATSREVNAYYDRLIAQAEAKRRELIAQAAGGGEYPAFIRSYVRIEAALRAERAAAIQMIEAEKNEARKTFERNAVKQIANTLIAAPGAQRVLGQVRETLRGAREAAVAVRAAAQAGRPIQAFADALAEKVGGARIVKEVAREVGSVVGHKIDRALGGVAGRLERAVDDIQGEMGGAIDLIDGLDAEVARYDEQERRAVSLVEDGTLLGNIVPVDRANATASVAAEAYAGAMEIAGALRGSSREAMRDRIRGALLDERLSRIWQTVCGIEAGQSYCTAADRAGYEGATAVLGEAPLVPINPEDARYWVCYETLSQAPLCAKMAGSPAEGETAVEGEEADAGGEEGEPEPTEGAPPPAAEVDPCTLIPVDESAITRRQDFYCEASIDALVGCDGCGSQIFLQRMESAERAAQLALEEYCGNPNFFACGESPIGDAGITSTDTSSQPYRPEVANVYYRLTFSYGPYFVRITTEIPGKEGETIAIGQEVIERIDASRSE
jgi:hypothetical protein